MSWFQTSANQTEAGKEHWTMFLAVDLDFPSDHLRLWSGFGDLTIDGNVYLGAGEMASASISPERSNLTVERKTYRLSGVDPAIVAESDIDGSFGRSSVEYFGFINNETGQLLDTPEINFEGGISNIRRMDGATPIIECNVENRLMMLEQNDGWRYTHEHQAQFYSGDLGFDQVPKVSTTEILWGGKRVVTGFGGGTRPGNPRRLPV